MKTNQISHRISLSVSVLAAIGLISTSCSKPEEPVAMSNAMIYTKSFSTKADRIEVFIDGNAVGSLTRGYIDLTGKGPTCEAPISGSLLNVDLAVGKHRLDAKEFKADKQIGSWLGNTITIDANACSPINLGASK